MLERIESEQELLGIPDDKFVFAMEDTGNTVSNTIRIALSQVLKQGRVAPGARVALVGFGVGLSWGCCLVRVP